MTLESDRLSTNPQISNSMKTRQVRAELFHADRHDEARSRFRSFVRRLKPATSNRGMSFRQRKKVTFLSYLPHSVKLNSMYLFMGRRQLWLQSEVFLQKPNEIQPVSTTITETLPSILWCHWHIILSHIRTSPLYCYLPFRFSEHSSRTADCNRLVRLITHNVAYHTNRV